MKLLYSFSASLPSQAQGNIIGNINGHEFGVSTLSVDISRYPHATQVEGNLEHIPPQISKYDMEIENTVLVECTLLHVHVYCPRTLDVNLLRK